jgi:hypothetical protein
MSELCTHLDQVALLTLVKGLSGRSELLDHPGRKYATVSEKRILRPATE